MKVRVAAAWALYWMGDWWWSIAVNRGLGNWFEWPYRLYNWFLGKSVDLQGDNEGPWGDPG